MAGCQPAFRPAWEAAEQVVGGHQPDQRQQAEGWGERRGRHRRGRVGRMPVPLVHRQAGTFQDPHDQGRADDQISPGPAPPEPSGGDRDQRQPQRQILDIHGVGRQAGPAQKRRLPATCERGHDPSQPGQRVQGDDDPHVDGQAPDRRPVGKAPPQPGDVGLPQQNTPADHAASASIATSSRNSSLKGVANTNSTEL